MRLGQPLVRGKALTSVVGTAPGSGFVTQINRGERRSLQSIVIRLEGDDEETFNAYSRSELMRLNRDQVRENLLASDPPYLDEDRRQQLVALFGRIKSQER